MNTNRKSLGRYRLAQLTLILVFGIALSSSATTGNPVFTTPFDSYGNMCWEDEQARLDNFAIKLQGSRELIGDIIVYAGRHSCPGEAKYRADRAKKWVVKRGVKTERVQVRDGGYREDVRTILILFTKEAESWSLNPTLKKEDASIRNHCVDKVFAKVICLNPRQ